MRVIGIVSEYNPFHNGHKFHLELSKKLCKAEYSVAIMSGNFLQRGEPALFDKWIRAKMAVLNGIDLVIELPVVYSCQVAELFALGAVKILNSLGIIDYLCFGSENGNIEDLYNISNILLNEPKEIKQEIKYKMSKGMTYSKAIGETYKDHYGDMLSYPNNVLGIEYIKSIILLSSSIKPVTIKRLMNNYSDKNFTGSISSATAIREEL
ncbi:MAG: nucleotidyltransferase family protein, partial [Lutispora sp.]|nr:nucleotidyltransferase family protein [Lutispora sp.]